MRKVLFLFGQLSDNDVEWIGKNGSTLSVPSGSTLIEEGVTLDAVFIVLNGALSVLPAALKGKAVAKLGPGEIVGEMSFLDERPPSATVRALEDSTCFSVPRDRLAVKLKEDSEFAAHFYRGLAVFLSHRQRATVHTLGYGEVEINEVTEDPDSLDPNVLDNIYLAGTRFDRLLKDALH